MRRTGSRAGDRDAWIVLSGVPGVGEELFALLLASFRTARGALDAVVDGRIGAWNVQTARQLGRVPINAPTMARLSSAAADPLAVLAELDARGIWTTTPLDPDFPVRLRDLDPPPAVIYGRGARATLDDARLVAIVGTRRPTPAGRTLARRIATRLMEWDAIVVSGVAVGIDGASQAAIAERGRPTIGVIGGGHDNPGPRAHAPLRDAILDAGGTLISEYPPSTVPTHGTYPRRNRIIAALGDATVVVEAPARSGALITANRALELGRPVFVAPGRVGDWSVAGSLALLREGPARPLVGIDELIDDLGYGKQAGAADVLAQAAPAEAIETLGPSEQAVARRLQVGPAGLDVLVAETGLPPGVVSSAVTLLLIRGWAESIGPAYAAAGALAR